VLRIELLEYLKQFAALQQGHTTHFCARARAELGFKIIMLFLENVGH